MTPDGRADPGFLIVFPSDPIAVRNTLDLVRAKVSGWGHCPDLCDSLELVLAEVLNNIVEHANRDQPGAPISLRVASSAQAMTCTLVDTGHAMPGNALPSATAFEPCDLPEGGFGWGLIHDLTTSLAYRRQDQENHLRFTIALEGSSIT